METDTLARVRMALLAAVCVLLLWCGGKRVWESVAVYRYWAWDFDLRRNEIACAHEGIDPFDVWERTVESERFCGFTRPDKPTERVDGKLYGDKRPVHAYPAWHMALFWWYGWVPKWVCASVMGLLYALCLLWVVRWMAERLRPAPPGSGPENALFLLAMSLYSLGGICWTMNYGVLLLACVLLMAEALDRGRDALAGVLYSIAMVKPQVGLLLAVPLLVGRKFKTLAVAAAICVAETLFSAWKLGKPPWELLLQIPQIGAPYEKGAFAVASARLVGPVSAPLVMVAFAGLAVAGCWLFRKAPNAWVRFLPALAAAPFWTYSQYHDWLAALPCCVCLLLHRERHPRLYGTCVLLAAAWGLVSFSFAQQWYFPTQPALAALLHLAVLAVCCFAAFEEMVPHATAGERNPLQGDAA